jgi:hypothetical protein
LVAGEKLGRSGCYAVRQLIEQCGDNTKIID